MLHNLLAPYLVIFRHREILGATTIVAIRQRYAGSALGLFWLVLAPLILLSLYSVIYLVVFRVRPMAMGQVDYVLYIFCGLIPFLGFAQGLGTGTTSLSLDRAILLNTVFPAEMVPFRSALASQVIVLVGLTMAIVGASLLGKFSPWMFLVPVMILLQVMFLSGIVWVLSLANLVLRDIEQVLVFFTLALLVATPIAYTPDMVSGPIKLLIYFNPFAYFVISYQHLILLGKLPDPLFLSLPVAFGVLSFSGGYWVFQRAKKVMFDYA